MEVRWRWEREVRVLRRERRVGRFLEKRRFWSVGEEEKEVSLGVEREVAMTELLRHLTAYWI